MKKLIFLTILILLLVFPLANSNINRTNEIQKPILFKPTVISVFKNGMAFIQKTANINANNGDFILKDTDIANKDIIFGTVWFSSVGNSIKNISTMIQEKEIEKSASSIVELCMANKNKEAIFKLRSYETPVVGKIISVEGNVVQIESKNKWIVSTFEDILHIEFNEKPQQYFLSKEKQKLLVFNFENRNINQQIEMIYMQKGISWSPCYNLLLIDDSKAKLSMQANLMNDIEDIENVRFNFIVGVPTFMHSNINSPLFSNQIVSEFIQSLTANPINYRYNTRNQYDNNMTSQTTYDQSQNLYSNIQSEDDEATTSEGLYFYKKDGISMKKGSRALFTIFDTDIEYEQLYSTELKPNDNYYSTYRSRSEKTENQNQVWHSIKFINKSKYPFTTGSIFITQKAEKELRPISQNTLKYTSSGGIATIKTTISPDIIVTDNEIEISRKEKAIENHDLVTFETTINIVNFKKKDIKLAIHRSITGELIKSSIPWKTESKLKTYNSKNKQNDTEWNIELKAGESKKIVYNYQIYVWR